MRSAMTSRKGINFSGHYVVSTNATGMSFHVCTSSFKKTKGRTESCFTLLLKLNDHPTRCFDFGLRRIRPNDCKFELD